MNSPLVSICILFYNTAPYIERCVRSIMEQTYQNLEYIFVNDGSTDDSLSVLENVLKEYPERGKNVTIISNDRNRGTAYSRRVSIENAKGEYITSVDSDDYVEQDMVQCMVAKAVETKAEIIIAGYYRKNEYTTELVEPNPCENGTDYMCLVLANLLDAMWGNLFLRSLFTEGRSCFAPEGLDFGEDRLMSLYLSSKVKHIATLNKPLYHYLYRSNSISNHMTEKHFRCFIQFWQEADRLLEELRLGEKYKYLVGVQKLEEKAFLLMHCNSNQMRKKYANLFTEEEKLYTPDLTRGLTLMNWLIKHHLWILTYCYQCYIQFIDRYKKS